MKKKLILSVILMSTLVGSSISVCAAPTSSSALRIEYETDATDAQLNNIKVLFNAEDYAEMYPDVVAEFGNDGDALWNHFVKYGLAEGRCLSRSFNVFAYRASYVDLREAFGNNIVAYYEHYAQFGKAEGRSLISVEAAQKAGYTVYDIHGVAYPDLSPVKENDTEDNKNDSNIAYDNASYSNVDDTPTIQPAQEKKYVKITSEISDDDWLNPSIPRQPMPIDMPIMLPDLSE